MFVKLQVWLHFYAEVRGLVNAFKRTISEGALPSCCWSFAKCDNFTPISVERHFPLPRQFVQRVNICLEAEPISIIVHFWACKLNLHVTTSGKSFMYIRNNVGPSTEPCGTPEVTDRSVDIFPRTATLWLLWARKLWIQFTMHPVHQYTESFAWVNYGGPCQMLSESLEQPHAQQNLFL